MFQTSILYIYIHGLYVLHLRCLGWTPRATKSLGFSRLMKPYVGMMKFPTEWKVIIHSCSKPVYIYTHGLYVLHLRCLGWTPRATKSLGVSRLMKPYVGMMKFPTEWKVIIHSCSKPVYIYTHGLYVLHLRCLGWTPRATKSLGFSRLMKPYVGMMKFPTEWKVIIHSCSKPPTTQLLGISTEWPLRRPTLRGPAPAVVPRRRRRAPAQAPQQRRRGPAAAGRLGPGTGRHLGEPVGDAMALRWPMEKWWKKPEKWWKLAVLCYSQWEDHGEVTELTLFYGI